MSATIDTSRELAVFLRTRRERLAPHDVELPRGATTSSRSPISLFHTELDLEHQQPRRNLSQRRSFPPIGRTGTLLPRPR